MEDRRIRKTKKALKETLILLLKDTPFEKISVTDICRCADTSRITFYTHYNDKYALADDIFQDMMALGDARYRTLQAKNNPGYKAVFSYNNILLSILDIFDQHYDFFQHVAPEQNPYLAFQFYSRIMQTIEDHTAREGTSHHLKHSPRQIAGFLCYGLAGFINECHIEQVPPAEIRRKASHLLVGLLSSSILVE